MSTTHSHWCSPQIAQLRWVFPSATSDHLTDVDSGILLERGVTFPATAKKGYLLQAFDDNIKVKAPVRQLKLRSDCALMHLTSSFSQLRPVFVHPTKDLSPSQRTEMKILR